VARTAGRNTWIALLRGVNVGGHRKLPMSGLREVLGDLGLDHVRTLIQSGNVVFESDVRPAARLERNIADGIEESFGFRPGCLVLDSASFRSALDSVPFSGTEDPGKIHLFFLDDRPEDPDLPALQRAATGSESFELDDRVLYLHAPDGIGRSRLVRGVERWLGVEATARNLRTLQRLLVLVEPGI
jgi:uncharacterized protein (DUF1697 family)